MSAPGPRCKPPVRQNGTSRENGSFPINFFLVSLYEYVRNRQSHVWEKPSNNMKKKKKEKKDGQTTNPCHSQHDVSFVIRTFSSFNLFRS